MDCIFCEIVQGRIPAKIAYEDEKILVFYDIDPQAPIHLLIIPKIHIVSLQQITQEHGDFISHLFTIIPKLADECSLAEGYRLVSNCGTHGGQLVPHLHFHLLGGRNLTWPPG